MATNLNNLGLEINPNLHREERAKVIASLLSSDPSTIKDLEHTFECILSEPETFYKVFKDAILHIDHEHLSGSEDHRLANYISSIEQLRDIMFAIHIDNKSRAALTGRQSGGSLN